MASISAQTGTKVYAIVNLVIVVLSSLFAIVRLVDSCIVLYLDFYEYMPRQELYAISHEHSLTVALLAALHAVALLVSLVNLLFSSFLMNGIRKQKPEHMKVYYIYGVVKINVALFVVLGLLSFSVGLPTYWYIYCIVLCVYFMYAMILHMIRRTYLQFETINKQFSHAQLNEKC